MQLRAAVDRGQITAAPDGDRTRAERLHGLAADPGGRADPLAAPGRRPLCHGSRMPSRCSGPGRIATPRTPALSTASSISPAIGLAQHLLLGRVVGHRERRDQRIERANALGLERARPDPGEIDLAGAHVVEDARLGIGLALAPVVDELDPQPPVRRAFDLPSERLELARLRS